MKHYLMKINNQEIKLVLLDKNQKKLTKNQLSVKINLEYNIYMKIIQLLKFYLNIQMDSHKLKG